MLAPALAYRARADLAQDARWANDFLGPAVTLVDGRQSPGAVHYWNDIVGVAFTRDTTIEIPPTPLDLNLDGRPDTTFGGRWELPGGILANADLVGLIPTPADPAGTVGEYSVSTGFLGVREELDPATRRGAGRFGFNCLLCHAGADERGNLLPGRPNTRINLGLIMASARVLSPDWVIRDGGAGAVLPAAQLAQREGLAGVIDFDANRDGQVTIAEWRAALRMPDALQTQALLLLAGPGRLDQSIDARMDGLIPLAQLNEHERRTYGLQMHTQKARAPKRSVFNPVSIPGNQIGVDVAHYSWSGKDSAFRVDAVDVLSKALKLTPAELAQRIGFPANGAAIDLERLQRALTLDFRNVATSGREADIAAGIGWPHKLLTGAAPQDFDTFAAFEAQRLRRMVSAPLPPPADGPDAALVARGRALFLERNCGTVLNQRVVLGRETRVPPQYAGIAVLAPLDRSRPLDARIEVRCATCHNYSPAGPAVALRTPLADFQRCDLCHFDHPLAGAPERFVPLAEHMQREALAQMDDCLRCHAAHPEFGGQVYSNSWLLPFDANGNGVTHGDEAADAAAGGIGTDAYLNLDSFFSSQLRPAGRDPRPRQNYLLAANARAAPPVARISSQGYGWVRVAPLFTLEATAPYLHNGSVPTLAALLQRSAERPRKFALGAARLRFEYDTALPGNGGMGHEFGVDFSAQEQAALLAFLRSLP